MGCPWSQDPVSGPPGIGSWVHRRLPSARTGDQRLGTGGALAPAGGAVVLAAGWILTWRPPASTTWR